MMRLLMRRFCVLMVGLLAGLLLCGRGPVLAAGIVVTSLDDDAFDAAGGVCGSITVSSLPGTDGVITLREALCAADNTPGADSITFTAGGVISVTRGQLEIKNDTQTSINGDVDADGDPDVELRYISGAVTSGTGLLEIRTAQNRVEGICVTASPAAGIYLLAQGSDVVDDNVIIRNWLGVDLSSAQRGNATYGLRILQLNTGSCSRTRVEENVISKNGSNGLSIRDVLGTQVLSNTIGLDPTGTAVLPNNSSGIALVGVEAGVGAKHTTIDGNIISGNSSNGIYMTKAQYVTITHNIIGLNAAGDQALGNTSSSGGGIYASSEVFDILVDDNVISGNRGPGINLRPGTTRVVIVRNKIGSDITGLLGLGNGRADNKDGIQLADAFSNTIGGPNPADRNVIVHNGRAGIFIAGELSDHNVIQNNFIGVAIDGVRNLGNGDEAAIIDTGDGGVYVHDGADDNLIQENIIRFNHIGVRFTGNASDSAAYLPPQNNRVLSNTITTNDKYGVANLTTHRNVTYATPAGGDNLIQFNVISGTLETGMFNYGASPHILDNIIADNVSFGVINRVYFGTDGADNGADDLLAMPYLANNQISNNGDGGILSRDTAPLNKATLSADNSFGSNAGNPHISQRWFAAVEVLSGTQTISNGLTVTITAQSGLAVCLGASVCSGSSFASAGGDWGIWGASGISYDDVELYYTEQSTWFELLEYEVLSDDSVVTYTSHLVQADGAQQGVRYFDFDAISTTQEISGDVNLPFCVATGILGDADHSLCRYQIAQVDVFVPGVDSDADGISDRDEGIADLDRDGIPDYQDSDSDGDRISDVLEGVGDVDADGVPNYRDSDSDGDGLMDTDEAGLDPQDPSDSDSDTIADYLEPNGADTDGDGVPNHQDNDDDGDGVSSGDEYDGDSDADGIPDYLEPADQDLDGDGTPDSQDADDDGDGLSSAGEYDQNGDGVPDDSDADGIPDYLESNSMDSDADGTINALDSDADADGLGDGSEFYSGEVSDAFCADIAQDSDGDGALDCRDNDVDGDRISNYLDGDADGDWLLDSVEGNADDDADGIPDWLDPAAGSDISRGGDSDQDGVPDAVEGGANPAVPPDRDGDGLPDYLDPDDDGDGLDSEHEARVCVPQVGNEDADGCHCTGSDCYVDSDNDDLPDYLDHDDDGDGTNTDLEHADPNTDGNPADAWDTDDDGLPNYLDPDDDGDGLDSEHEARVCVPQAGNEDADGCHCTGGDCYVDSDNDDLPDYLDPDDDGDGTNTDLEHADPNADGDPADAWDTDDDGVPDYLDAENAWAIFVPLLMQSYPTT